MLCINKVSFVIFVVAPPGINSTVGIGFDPYYFKETTGIWKTEDQAAKKEEMAASFKHYVARVLADFPREQELTSEEKTMDKSKDRESSPTSGPVSLT